MDLILLLSLAPLWFTSSGMVMVIGMIWVTTVILGFLLLNSGITSVWLVMFLSFVGGLVALVGFMVSTHDDPLSKTSSGIWNLALVSSWSFWLVLSLLWGYLWKDFRELLSFASPHLSSSVILSEVESSMGLLSETTLIGLVIACIAMLYFGLFITHEVIRSYNQDDLLV